MIYSGDKEIVRFILDGQDVPEIFQGIKLVWFNLIEKFKREVLADSGTFDEELFRSEFERQLPILQKEPIALLIPGAYKAGVIYGMDTTTGGIIPFTFDRASTGSYIDKNGVMQIAGSNIPRIDYSKGYPAYLLERSSTNLDKNNNFVNGGSAVYTPNYVTYKGVSYGRFVGATLGNHIKDVTLLTGITGALTISYNVKDISGTGIKYFIFSGTPTGNRVIQINTINKTLVSSSGLTVSATFKDIGDGYTKMTLVLTNTDSATSVYPLYGNGEFYISDFQIEAVQFPTSHVNTAGSQVTRAKDNLSVYDLLGDEGSVYMECELPDLSGLDANILGRGMGTFWYRNILDDSNFGLMYDGSSSISVETVNSPGKNKYLGSMQTGGQKKLGMNGTLVKNPQSGTMGKGSSINAMNGNSHVIHLRSLALFPRQLSDQEHIDITQP